MSETLYAGSVEYLYCRVTGFDIDGVPADPTTYTPEVALVAPGQNRSAATWLAGTWVTVDGEDWIRVLAGSAEPLVAGVTRVFVRLAGAPETIVRKAGQLSVE
jgi:hypothetical protein